QSAPESPRDRVERGYLSEQVSLDNRDNDPRWATAKPVPGLYEGYARQVEQPNLAAILPQGATSVYHETSLRGARELILRAEAGPRGHFPFYVSDNPDLALGQGGKGYLLE